MKRKILGIFTAFIMMMSICSLSSINAESNALTDSVVAQVNNTTYSSISEAFSAASIGGTITLLADVETENSIDLRNNANVTLDLNGHKLNQKLKTNIGNTPGTIRLFDSSLIIKDSLGTGELHGYQTPVGVFRNSTFTLESGTLIGEWYGLSGNGLNENNTTINIKGGTIKSNDPEAAAFYHPQTGTINISGGKIIGSTGVQLASGSLSVVKMSGGTIQATGEDKRIDKGTGNGAVSDGAAISIVNRPGYPGIPTAEISGGTFTSAHNEAVLAYTWKAGVASVWDTATSNVKIHGGTFSSDVSTFVTAGNKVYAQDGVYVVASAASAITLDQSSVNMEVGTNVQLHASVVPEGTLDVVSWNSTDEKVATVDQNGLIKAIATGTTTISATVNGISASSTISVYKVEKPTIPTTSTGDDKTTAVIDNSSITVLSSSLKNVIENMDTTSAISAKTKTALKEAIADLKVISVTPEVKAISSKDIVKDTLNSIEKTLGNKGIVAQYFKLDMNITADGNPIGTINELTGKISFTVTIDKTLIKDGRTFFMLREHNGVFEKIEGTLVDNEFTFETDKFSIFALVYENTQSTGKPVDTNDTTNTTALIALMGFAIVVAGVTVVAHKRAIHKI